MSITNAELLARIEALEAKAKADVPIDGLPLAQIQRRLETTWRPDAATLLRPRSVTSDALVLPETFVPTMVNGWTVQAGFSARVVKTAFGIVNVKGVFNSAAATNVTAFTLPVGWRPLTLVMAVANHWTGAARILGSVQVATDGSVKILNNADGLGVLTDHVVNVTFSTQV